LSQRDLKNLAFYCEDFIGESAAENISCGIDLFTRLKHQNKLGPEKYGYLREGLLAVGRVDLAKKLPSDFKLALSQVPQLERSAVISSVFTEPVYIVPNPPSRQEVLATVSPRAQLFQIGEQLNSEDISKLAFLFADKLSLNAVDKVNATPLLSQLETTGAINPKDPERLRHLLYMIGRKDLASLLLSMQTPQSILTKFGHSHQLIGIKFSMLAEKQACYSFQRKLLAAVVSGGKETFEEQVVKPIMQRLLQSYDYSVISNLCISTLKASCQDVWNLDELLRSTLPLAFDFMDAYRSAIHHYLNCEGGVIEIEVLKTLIETCSVCYMKLEGIISGCEWNTALRNNIQKDITQRRTIIGSPAHVAVSCIYEIYSELSGRDGVHLGLEAADGSVHTLEWLYYSCCYRIVVSQWLETMLCLITDSCFAKSISYSHSTLRETLLQIAHKYQHQISQVHSMLVNVVGGKVISKIAEELHKEGICIDENQTERSDSVYINNMGASMYTYLVLLLQFSYFGGEDLKLSITLLQLRAFHCAFMSSEFYIPSALTIYRNLLNAYESQIEKFKTVALRSNSLCAPVIRHFIPE
jgi:hypothetical protein